MPLYNPLTNSKVCSKCTVEFVGDDVPKNFFKVQAMKDGYATRCKKCYYVKATPDERQARNDRVIERKFTKMVEAEPIKEVPASKKPFSHTDLQIQRVERRMGVKFLEWMDMGDMWVPKFTNGSK